METLEQIINSPAEFLRVDDIAPFLGVHPQSIREQVRKDASALGFKVSVIGSKVFVPKKPFVDYWRGE